MKRIRVIVVDDHAVVLRGLREVISQTDDMEVVAEGHDGHEAVRLASENHPDVMVLDVSMPRLDGMEAMKLIRTCCPEVKVLALTMHDDRAHFNRMLEGGAAGYVLKQSPAPELLRAIRTVASGGTYVDPLMGGGASGGRDRASGAHASEEVLSCREEEVLRLTAWGHSNKAIGKTLEISPRTVETYRSRIAEKLGLHTRAEIVRYAVARGWLASDGSILSEPGVHRHE
jgi:DNA-binding NarL/FixJ family response regulator